MIIRPFRKSIHVRFRLAFVLSLLGLVLLAAITIVSSLGTLSTFEERVSEVSREMLPANHLSVTLNDVDHLAYRHAIEGDRSARVEFEEAANTVDRLFDQLTRMASDYDSEEHAHSAIPLNETVRSWHNAKAAVLEVFRQTPRSVMAVEALGAVHAILDPVTETISEYHHAAMIDLQRGQETAETIVQWAFFAMFSTIMIGVALLIALGIVVSRSILDPLNELQAAARKLGDKDFSHRIKLRNFDDELGQLGRTLNFASATLRRLHSELERRAIRDGLTGAFNRATFNERLDEECKSADRHKRSLALLLIDIDFFKQVNDRFGHQAGDRVLQNIVRLLEETTRPKDVVARYGGEEFAVILPEADGVEAKAMAERFRKCIENERVNCAAGQPIAVTVSIGCAIQRPNTVSPVALISAADMALYRAKETGRNRVVSAGELVETAAAIVPKTSAA